MKVIDLPLPGLKLLEPVVHGDARGSFRETYNARAYAQAGIANTFVQDNAARSVAAGTLRGLHFQKPPHAQAKLVSVTRGAIIDVVVDLRRQSPTYGRHHVQPMDDRTAQLLYVPIGFAHAYCTVQDDTEVAYKVDAYYAPEAEAGVRWDDPALGIDWPYPADALSLAERDRALPLFADLPAVFTGPIDAEGSGT